MRLRGARRSGASAPSLYEPAAIAATSSPRCARSEAAAGDARNGSVCVALANPRGRRPTAAARQNRPQPNESIHECGVPALLNFRKKKLGRARLGIGGSIPPLHSRPTSTRRLRPL